VLERRNLRPGGGPAGSEPAGDIRAAVADLEKRSIEGALSAAGGNKSKAAGELGISRFALQRKLEKYGLASKGGESAPADAGDTN
jgi:transcriptional regulator with PAS, ATPase and Fis domain